LQSSSVFLDGFAQNYPTFCALSSGIPIKLASNSYPRNLFGVECMTGLATDFDPAIFASTRPLDQLTAALAHVETLATYRG